MSAETVPADNDDDLAAQQRELERQRQEIDRKLAQIAARRRRGAAASEPAAGQTHLPQAPAPAPGLPAHPAGEPPASAQPAPAPPGFFNLHGQSTVITEAHDAFHAPYQGPNSLARHETSRTSFTGTLFMGLRLPWPGGEVYFDPEVAGGEGFSGVTGIAAFPNGEIPRVGTPEPEPYVARLFYRQTFGLGGETEKLADGPNQLAAAPDVSRLTLTLGKFSADDFFQQSAYTNDPRAQFMNWALFTDGAWDYPADTRGYTEGAVVELNQANWALRYGAMAMPKVANGGTLDSRVPKALSQMIELEERYKWLGGHAGAFRLMGYANSAHMGNYREAAAAAGRNGSVPDVTSNRSFSVKYGFGLTVDQELTDDLGAFLRLSWNDGHTESFAFTAIDRSAAFGLSLKGARWNRPQDVAGIAAIIGGLAHDHREYLAAGGLDFIIGDGQLTHYAPEEIIEVYYRFSLSDNVWVTPELQLVDHPAYNADRGPVFIGGFRVHAEF